MNTKLPQHIENLLKERYYLKSENSWGQVAKRVSETIHPPMEDLIKSRTFIPSTPTLMNLNTNGERKGTLSSCFILGIEDSIDGIMDSMKEAAFVTKAAGGVGFNFSKLRGANENVKSISANSGGVMAFIQIFDSVLDGVRQGGRRRGAGMSMLSIYHPDILSFIDAKAGATDKYTRSNFSVRPDRAFYKVLEADPHRVFQTVNVVDKAKNNLIDSNGVTYTYKMLWDKIIHNAWLRAEPGIFNGDIAIERCSCRHITEDISSNPCLTGDTLVYVADGRGNVSIKTLADEGRDVDVFSMSHEGNVVVKRMINPRMTQQAAKVYKVTFDSGMEIRATENHELVSTSGSSVKISNLSPGDSIKSILRNELTIGEGFFNKKESKISNTGVYLFVENNGEQEAEHRIIANAIGDVKGKVVHHKDFNSQNNSPQNLEIMSYEAHRSLHSNAMAGKNNPVHKIKDKIAWANRISLRVKGLNNPNSSELSNEELVQKIKDHSRKTIFNLMCASECEKINGFPKLNNQKAIEKYRLDGYREYCELANVKYVPGNIYHSLSMQVNNLKSNYSYSFDDSSLSISIHKKCECCGAKFSIAYESRQVTFCSHKCLAKSLFKPYQFKNGLFSETYLSHPNVQRRLSSTFDVFNLYRSSKFVNFKKESSLANSIIRPNNLFCPSVAYLQKHLQDVNCVEDLVRIAQENIDSSNNKSELSSAIGQSYNHKVVSVVPCGVEDVYDATVEDTHSFFIGGRSLTNQYGRKSEEYILTKNCSEYVHLPYTSCNLGSINVSHFYKDETFDWEGFRKATEDATVYLNGIIDKNDYPIEKIRKETLAVRPIGLGMMGVAHLLFLMGFPYDSENGYAFTRMLMRFQTVVSMKKSMELAKEYGKTYPYYDHKTFMDANVRFFDESMAHFGTDIEKLAEDIEKYGVYNSCFTSIAPTGTISYVADCSSGIEPVFGLVFTRKIEKDNRSYEHVFLVDPIFKKYVESKYPESFNEIYKYVSSNKGSCQGCPNLTKEEQDIFKVAGDISPEWHVKILSAIANNVSLSVSKCVAKGTKILTDKGIINIEDLGVAKGEDVFDKPVADTKVKDQNGDWKKITGHYSGGIRPTKIIRFDNGNTLEFAHTHRLMTSRGWITTSNLKINDYVYSKAVDYDSENVGGLPIVVNFKDETNSNEIFLPETMNEDLALFLGMIAADGHLVESTGCVGITTADDLVDSTFRELCKKIFKTEKINTQPDKRTKNTRSVYLTSRKLCRYVVNILKGHNCITKQAPEQIINGSRLEKIAFINGSTLDGYVTRNRLVLYEGYSQILADSIFHMCCSLGLKPAKGKKFVKTGRLSKWSYYVSVGDHCFSPVEKHKNKKLSPCYIIPVPEKIKGMSYKGLDKKYHNTLRTVRKNKYRGIRTNNSLLDFARYDKSVYLLKIVSIEDSSNEVYDIEVEDTHTYLIDNIVSHNTINLPNNCSEAELSKVFLDAQALGIIGVTVYRDGSREGILVHEDDSRPTKFVKTSAAKRPKELSAKIFTCNYKKEKLYVAIGFWEDGSPYEIFVGSNTKDEFEHATGKIAKISRGKYAFKSENGDEYHLNNGNNDENADALCRILSASLRHGCDLQFLVHQLEKTEGDLMSFSKVISRVLKKLIKDGTEISGEECECGGKLIRSEGCKTCPSCGVSKCG